MHYLNWKKIYYGKVQRQEVQLYTADSDWQVIRLDMKGKTLEYKYNALEGYLVEQEYNRKSKVCVANYITALSRGGLIVPADYL